MGGLKAFQIQFDNPIATYYGGQVVSGRVIVKLDREKSMRGIEIKFHGRAEVKWRESRKVRTHKKSHTEWRTYHASEQYFENQKYLIGSSDGDMVLPPAEHVYPFNMTLPTNLPSSFEGDFGYVRYTVKATINRPWKFDHEAKAAFTVLSLLDLNAEQDVREPKQAMMEKNLCCWCCKSGPITMMAILPVTGYVPGQEMPITVEVDNNTNEMISNVSCRLKKIVKFHGRHHFSDKIRTVNLKVAEKAVDEVVRPHGSGCWTVKLRVPPVPPSYLKHCSIIDLSYELSVKAIIPGFHKSMHIHLPLVLGTIPLSQYFPSLTPTTDLPPSFSDIYGADFTPSAPGLEYPLPSAPVEPRTLYPEMPPPTYEECMFGKRDIKEHGDSDFTHGDTEFAPRYPMYQFNL